MYVLKLFLWDLVTNYIPRVHTYGKGLLPHVTFIRVLYTRVVYVYFFTSSIVHYLHRDYDMDYTSTQLKKYVMYLSLEYLYVTLFFSKSKKKGFPIFY